MAIMYRTMDVRALDYPAAQFHVVLDKVLTWEGKQLRIVNKLAGRFGRTVQYRSR